MAEHELIAHFYHVWCDGDWLRRNWRKGEALGAQNHVQFLHENGFQPDYLHIGLVGTPAKREKAKSWFNQNLSEMNPVFTEADHGYEQVTLTELRSWCQTHREAKVLYAHSKGAYNATVLTYLHLKVMNDAVIGRWREARRALDEHDVAGAMWTAEPAHYTGNFWWANASYISTLAEPPTATRWEAEMWLGQGHPHAYDLCPEMTYQSLIPATYGPDEAETGPTPIPGDVKVQAPLPGSGASSASLPVNANFATRW